jgi:hypothetical protein
MFSPPMRSTFFAVTVFCVTACTETAATTDAQSHVDVVAVVDVVKPDAVTSDVSIDKTPVDPWRCATPDGCMWIENYQREIVGKLSGERPIAEGITLARRYTAAQRETTRSYLRDELRVMGFEADYHVYSTGSNVRAVIAATGGSSAPPIVIGAHYDGVAAGPAAADDGTGVALVLSVARYLGALPRRDHPVEVLLFDQEEEGLIGSAAYATLLRSRAQVIDSMHMFDMLSFDGDGDNAIELWSPTAGLEDLYRLHAMPRRIPVNAVRFLSSDHQSFLSRGFPAVGVGEEFVGNDHTPHYHRASDRYEVVNFEYLQRMTRLAMDVFADRVVD